MDFTKTEMHASVDALADQIENVLQMDPEY